MKITIDTKEDSHGDIKKVIRMLNSLVEGKEVFSNQGNIFEDNKDVAEQGNAFVNMFGSSEEKKEDAQEEDNKVEADKEEVQENAEDSPKIREYV